MPRIINLKAIEKADIRPLFQFFESQAAMGITMWHKNQTYILNNGMEFSFKNDVFQRARNSKPAEVRYEVISNKPSLGQGGFGEVKFIKGTLALDEKEVRFKKVGKDEKKRVVKIQKHHPIHSPLMLPELEYKYGSRAPHCAIKQPVVIFTPAATCTSYLAMRRHPGINLFNIMIGMKLTTPERIALSKGLLQALKMQVTDINLIHRDIKPENIIVHMGPPMNIRIIDYASCRERSESDKAYGTPSYTAPENFYPGIKEIGYNSDIYSMGRVIALLWNVNCALYKGNGKHIHHTPEQKLSDLFYRITGLHPTVKEHIKTTLMGMLSNDPTTRLSLDDAITAFARIGVYGTEPLLGDLTAACDVPTTATTSAAGADSTTFAHAIATFGLMPTAPRTDVDKPPSPDSSCSLI